MFADIGVLSDAATIIIALAALAYIATLFRHFKGGLYERTFQLSFVALLLLTAGRLFDLVARIYNSLVLGVVHDAADILSILVLSAAMIALYREWRKIG